MTVVFHLLDTDIARYIIKGRSPEIENKLAIVPPDRIGVSAITKAELLYGLKRLPLNHRLHIGVHQFLKIVQVLAWDTDAADYYANIRHQLTTQGHLIGEMDMMIASHALAIGAILVTNNTKHFNRIDAPLVVENWSDGG
jgi:tRNA(fMet)-specific endonuclease VapC